MRPANVKARLTLVGAGPGDPELISVKGTKALMQADVVLYDALVHPKLLDYAPTQAERVYVGKRANQHRYSQTEINYLIAAYAFNYGHVVRLKGGDPFIFARGHEELMYAESMGIYVEIVPGISSVAAVPGLQGIPLTKRGINESFWVITGTTSDGALSHDVYAAAHTNASVVILMGRRKLGEIVSLYDQAGKTHMPIAVIQSGSLPNERIALGTIQSIQSEVKRLAIGSPAIIIIGEVVRLHAFFPLGVFAQEALVSYPSSMAS